MNNSKLFKYILYLSIIGIFLATYLFYNFLTKPLIESCYVNSVINCDAVTKGSLSTMFGMPVSLIGLIGYIIILFSAVLKKSKLLLAMSLFGMIFCLTITFQEIFNLKVICPVCLACQLVMLFVFLLSLKLNFGLRKN